MLVCGGQTAVGSCVGTHCGSRMSRSGPGGVQGPIIRGWDGRAAAPLEVSREKLRSGFGLSLLIFIILFFFPVIVVWVPLI